jgi:threonine synthase
MIACTNCRRPYPEADVPFRCPVCGGAYDWTEFPAFDPGAMDRTRPGVWRYRRALGLPESAPEVTLGEGNTPLLWGRAFGREVAFKAEFQQPTGSYKDRGSAVLLSFLRSRGVTEAVEDSSGNAGASFAAYAARAGVRARVFVPGSASGPKRAQIGAYGAQVVSVPGPRSEAAAAVREAAGRGAVYASHAFLPHGLPGYATAAYEIVEALGQAPGAVVVPAGQGNFLLALGRGFAALRAAGVIDRLPPLYGVQARACAPLWAVFQYGPAGLGWVSEGETLAEGVRVRHPARGDAVLLSVAASGGALLAVDEEEILPGRDELSRQGLYVEPTSAIVWGALEQIPKMTPEPVVVILTGSGLKTEIRNP